MNKGSIVLLRLVTICVVGLPACGVADDICVVNGTNDRYYFSVETKDGVVDSGSLVASGRLCVTSASEDSRGGRVSATLSKESAEGCIRLLPDNSTETLLRFIDGDRCTWSSQPRGRRR